MPLARPRLSPPAIPRDNAATEPPVIPAIASASLFGPRKTLQIDHCGQRYTLRITRENKLILTK